MSRRLRPGDWVQVKLPAEILAALDADGATDHLPFMPEMLEFCGRTFRVARRVVKSCSSGVRSSMRAFPVDDVVLLEGLRCTGESHDGCQKACAIFWREAWLTKQAGPVADANISDEQRDRLATRLKTKQSPTVYYCQASELLRATYPLTRPGRVRKCLADVRAGNTTLAQMARFISIWTFWRLRRRLLGEYARGHGRGPTPTGTLGLQAGDLVTVKPMSLITQTLNESGYNRGLYFSPDMRLLCGTSQCVERRIEKIIVDGTGEMRQLRNTVYLNDSRCGCAHVAFGGCSRGEFTYWREVWLNRSAN